MDGTRTIFHSDLNSFFASVEILLNPELRGLPVAVCGSTENRHGIVLAKSDPAKRAGIKTGMTNGEAQRLCHDLVLVPPHFDEYLKYSAMVRKIYESFTDSVEPFGMDECWLQVLNRKSLADGGSEIAEQIRSAVKDETGLTVSVGVSFNKVFAKLGSDMKKPDAVTIITEEDFRTKVWRLPVEELLFVGRATRTKLNYYGIRTIGQLAGTDPAFLKRLLGVSGLVLWNYANGLDNARVMPKDFSSPAKSVGHGITCKTDLVSEEEVWLVILSLCQDIGHRLRQYGQCATGVQLCIKDNDLSLRQYQAPLPYATQSPLEIAMAARELFNSRHVWLKNIRAVTVRAIDLIGQETPYQTDMFMDVSKIEKREKIDAAVEKIRCRYGSGAVEPASLLLCSKLPDSSNVNHTAIGHVYQ